ncbi:hypothetical protein D9M69_627580 [compost metagenome]
MIVGNYTTTATEADHRSAQYLGQLTDLGARLERARANEDHRRSRLAQQLRCLLHSVRVDGRRRLQLQWLLQPHCGSASEVVPRSLQGNDSRAAGLHFLERLGHLPGSISRLFDVSSPLANAL